MIGDGVSREIRRELSYRLEEYACDFIGTSSLWEDPCFYHIFKAFFKNTLYPYDMILINIGGKHGYYLNVAENKDDANKYKRLFENFVEYLSAYSDKIIVLTVTPNKCGKFFKL
ncbi:MAG: hypothetical protein IJ545_01475 [Alphaproteobacteria bacterium]|nr:hypothetical protein [Alphaproteobacteria bacterium]